MCQVSAPVLIVIFCIMCFLLQECKPLKIKWGATISDETQWGQNMSNLHLISQNERICNLGYCNSIINVKW